MPFITTKKLMCCGSKSKAELKKNKIRYEGHIYAKFILANYPNAKIAILYQNDDFGKDFLAGFRERFGDKLLRSVIARTVKFPDATVAGQPITQFAPDSQAAESYRTVARELVDRGCAP